MTTLFKRFAIFWLLLTVLTSCGIVATRNLTNDNGTGTFTCRSTAGAYSLPLSKLEITVTEKRNRTHLATGDPRTTVFDATFQQQVYPDPRRTFCLDFLNSFTSVEALQVEKIPGTNLLDNVSINTDDRLDDVIQDATNSLLTNLRSDQPQIEPGDIKDTFEFDPLNRDDLLILNSELGRFGFCVLVRIKGRSTESIDMLQQQNCNRRLSPKALTDLAQRSSVVSPGFETLPENYRNSILYRPTVTADIFVMYQPNRQVPGKWVVYEKRVVTLVDPQTIHGLDIRRAVFARRDTVLNFDNGVLTEISINKGSEVAEFVKIPLSIVRAIVRLPTEIIQIRIGRTNQMRELVDAQSQLIATQAAAQQARDDLAAQNSLSGTRAALGLRSSGADINQCVAGCRSDGRDLPSCNQACSCATTTCSVGDLACQRACGL